MKFIRQGSEQQNLNGFEEDDEDDSTNAQMNSTPKTKPSKKSEKNPQQPPPPSTPVLSNFAPVRVFQCSSCHQQGTYKWVVERHIRAKHPDQANAHVIELPAELSVRLQKISPPLKRFRCSLCPLQSTHSWVVIRVCSSILNHPISRESFPSLSSSTSNISIRCKQQRSWIFNPTENPSLMIPKRCRQVRTTDILSFDVFK